MGETRDTGIKMMYDDIEANNQHWPDEGASDSGRQEEALRLWLS